MGPDCTTNQNTTMKWKWDVLEDCAAFYLSRFCQAEHDAQCAVHSHCALPQASSSWHWDTAPGTRNVQNTGTSLWHSSGLPASIFLPLPWHFLYLIDDVPALPFAKGLRGFCISVLSLCHFSWISLVHVGLCSSVRCRCELGAVPLGLLPSLSHPPSCLCPLHSCSARFWFTDHTCLLTK